MEHIQLCCLQKMMYMVWPSQCLGPSDRRPTGNFHTLSLAQLACSTEDVPLDAHPGARPAKLGKRCRALARLLRDIASPWSYHCCRNPIIQHPATTIAYGGTNFSKTLTHPW